MLIHVVKRGETLWQLARLYNVSIDAIQQVNVLPNPNRLLLGQSLVIPVPGSIHTIQYGDTLWSLSRQYGVSVNAILQANQTVNPNMLLPGSTLYIPPILHTVQPGQNLTQIASLYGTTVEAILRENGITNPNLIYAGSQLIIPRSKPVIEVNAYSYQKDQDGANSVNAIGHLLTYFGPFAYLINEDGTLEPFDDDLMIKAAVSNNVVPMLVVTNLSVTSTGTNLAHAVLSNPQIRETLITNMLQDYGR